MNSTEKLIKLVELHRCLYDRRHREYKNTSKKAMLWEKIAKELNQSCELIQAKWKNLKDGYTKYKKNMNATTGNKKAYVNWVWGPYLNFLEGAMEHRRRIMPTLPGPTEESDIIYPLDDEAQFLPSRSPSPYSQSEQVDLIEESQSSPRHSSRKRTYNDQDDSNRLAKVLKYIEKIEKKDSIDLLFASYAEALKKMKPRTQASLKLKLAQIFAEAELEDLQSENLDPILTPAYTVLNYDYESGETSSVVKMEK